ncbi:DNA polymerase III subunit gamma/tau [Patescibacteria group bacterium]|nr:DNA polymerase III subunit gamma/tau [Patescibacteria group bacterium]
MNNTYYLKYRPQTIEQLDIKEIRESLSKILKSGKIPHAFLFSGPKGTGKTSAARILAKIVNCEKPKVKGVPCNKCDQCKSITNGNNIDVIELDAASNRGIDDIRALREAVKLSAAKAQKKVYIIDEAHMLTLEASNALLKTLEEPPSHVIFILATTNPEKLIGTIRSRTTNINFRKAKVEELVKSLKRITKGEKIKIDESSLKLISKKAGGSFRDAAKILEQIVTEKVSLKKEKIEEYLNISKESEIEEFVDFLSEKNAKKLINIIEKVVSLAGSVNGFLENVIDFLRKGLLEKFGIGEVKIDSLNKKDLITLLGLLTETEELSKISLIEQLPLEIAVIKWCSFSEEDEEDKESKTLPEKTEKVEVSKKQNQVEVIQEQKNVVIQSAIKSELNGKISEVTEENWKTILAKVRPINATIEALLRATKPIGIYANTLKLGVFYKFHKERLEDIKNKRIFEDVVGEIFGRPIKLVCTLTEPPKRKEEPIQKTEDVLTKGEDKDIIKIAEEIFSTN